MWMKLMLAHTKKRRNTAQIDNVSVCLTSACRDIHHRQRSDGVREQDREDRDAALVGPAQEVRSLAVLGHVEHCAAADIDGAVAGG